jgi:hypothetical protein
MHVKNVKPETIYLCDDTRRRPTISHIKNNSKLNQSVSSLFSLAFFLFILHNERIYTFFILK